MSRHGRERLNHDRRRELISAAARLFAEKGFHGTSMDDIAAEIGMLKGSLYYWIESKEALLREVLLGTMEAAIQEALPIPTQDLPASERLRQLIRIHISSWVENPHNFNVFLTEYKWLDEESLKQYGEEREKLESLYKTIVRDGIASGEFRVPTELVSIIVNSILGAVNWFPRWYQPRGWASPETVADVITDLVVRGLRGEREGAPS